MRKLTNKDVIDTFYEMCIWTWAYAPWLQGWSNLALQDSKTPSRDLLFFHLRPVSPHLMLATTCYYVCNLLPKQLRGTVETQFFSEPCSRPWVMNPTEFWQIDKTWICIWFSFVVGLMGEGEDLRRVDFIESGWYFTVFLSFFLLHFTVFLSFFLPSFLPSHFPFFPCSLFFSPVLSVLFVLFVLSVLSFLSVIQSSSSSASSSSFASSARSC